jgi:hypothetical protein
MFALVNVSVTASALSPSPCANSLNYSQIFKMERDWGEVRRERSPSVFCISHLTND